MKRLKAKQLMSDLSLPHVCQTICFEYLLNDIAPYVPVKIYSATVEGDGATVEPTSATALVALCTADDGSNSFCSAALLDASEWTEVTRKTKTGRPRRPPSMQGSTERSQEALHVKE
ncbi:hypothetical protein MHU86_20013 [Fragilaria crotonensis]|nr:hypothetical protein MHU86_20013 [Fragilaria crotonensis]